MHVLTKTAIIFISLCLSHGVSAEKIYRSVDKKGEVTFSDEPPPSAVNVEQVEIQPAPTESEYRESVERVQRMESQAGEMGAARTERAPPPVKLPEEVQPTGTIRNYDDEYGSPYDRARHRDAIRNRPGERPAQMRARRPAGRPSAPGGGGGGR